MADAPGHQLGQIIGRVLEAALLPVLQQLADEHGLYLDSSHGSRSVRPGKKVTWRDAKGNGHDLDFVFERGGSASHQGYPAAFVEAAWRRYNKHSKAKAQEISGALDPLLMAFAQVKPTGAAVVAGRWTKPALEQLRTNGYVVVHFDFGPTVDVFARHGMQIGGTGEKTSDAFWQQQCDAFLAKDAAELEDLAADLRETMKADLEAFAAELEWRIVRSVDYVTVIPLHGDQLRLTDVSDAITAVQAHPIGPATAAFLRFEVHIAYTNGDLVQASFATAGDATAFLQTFT